MATPDPKPTDGARERQALIAAGLLRPNAGVAVTRRSPFPLSEPSPERDHAERTLRLDPIAIEAAKRSLAGPRWLETLPPRPDAQ
jgi:hypothetical protein